MTESGSAETPDGRDPETATDDGIVVDWDVRIRRRLRTVGLAESTLGTVDVVVVDRRGCETTPCQPGFLSIDGHRVLVVPDRRDGAASVEVWVAGTPERYGGVVRTLRWSVALDASVEAAFESASRGRRDAPESDVSTDGGSTSCLSGWMVLSFDATDTALALGGFAGSIEPLE